MKSANKSLEGFVFDQKIKFIDTHESYNEWMNVWILCGRKHDYVTPLLRELHWLPVEQRIIFKILFFTFKALNNLLPGYISDLLETYKPTRSLRSSSRNLLVIPRSELKSYGDRTFSVSAPKLWNNIPETIKCSVDLNTFKRNLRTYLLKRYFYEWLRWLLLLFFTLIVKRLKLSFIIIITITILIIIIIIIIIMNSPVSFLTAK